MTDSDATVRAAVLDAALTELQQWGVDRFSIEGVAHRSDLDANLIRQSWERPQDLIFDALVTSGPAMIDNPDTGSFAGDLRALAEAARAYLNDPVGRRIVRMLVIDGKSHTVDDETRRMFWNRHLGAMDSIVARAITRDQIRPGIRSDTVLQLLIAPLQTFALYNTAPLGRDYCRTVADLVVRAVSSTGP